MQKNQKKLSPLERTQILMHILQHKDPEQIFIRLSATQMKDLRDFLENEIVYVSSSQGSPVKKNELKDTYPVTSEYYRKQDCHEPLESCLDETCYRANPVCFSLKMKTHIAILLDKIQVYL
jgi:hypothetical protein